MANFFVRVRESYRDITGLALDLAPDGVVANSSERVIRWNNTARRRKVGSTRARFGNATQSDSTLRPTADGDAGAIMSSTSQLVVPLEDGSFGPTIDLCVAFEVDSLTAGAGNKLVLSNDAATFKIYQRESASGFAGYRDNGSNTLDGAILGAGVHLINSSYDNAPEVSWLQDNVSILTGSMNNITLAGSAALYIGNPPGGDTGIEGTLRSLRIWDRALSDIEQDFAYQTLAYAGGALNTDVRAVTNTRVWEDRTGDGITQTRRVNPLPGAAQRYHYAVGAFPFRVQMACEIEGEVLGDADLAGALFSASVLEQPTGSAAVVFAQDADFSAVFDVVLPAAGHYTLLFAREGKGGKIVHLDTEAS